MFRNCADVQIISVVGAFPPNAFPLAKRTIYSAENGVNGNYYDDYDDNSDDDDDDNDGDDDHPHHLVGASGGDGPCLHRDRRLQANPWDG